MQEHAIHIQAYFLKTYPMTAGSQVIPAWLQLIKGRYRKTSRVMPDISKARCQICTLEMPHVHIVFWKHMCSLNTKYN